VSKNSEKPSSLPIARTAVRPRRTAGLQGIETRFRHRENPSNLVNIRQHKNGLGVYDTKGGKASSPQYGTFSNKRKRVRIAAFNTLLGFEPMA
jgi:hypothetical protein